MSITRYNTCILKIQYQVVLCGAVPFENYLKKFAPKLHVSYITSLRIIFSLKPRLCSSFNHHLHSSIYPGRNLTPRSPESAFTDLLRYV